MSIHCVMVVYLVFLQRKSNDGGGGSRSESAAEVEWNVVY